MLSMDENEMLEKIIMVAGRLVATDLVNDYQPSRYKDGNDLKMRLAVQDAADIVVAAYEETATRILDIQQIDEKIAAAESGEVSGPPENHFGPRHNDDDDEEAVEVEMAGPPGPRIRETTPEEQNELRKERRKCTSRKSSSKTSASTRRAKTRSARA